MTRTTTMYSLAISVLLSACGGGGSSSTAPPFDDTTGQQDTYTPEGPIYNACSAFYFKEISGTYTGAIYYNNDQTSCTWNDVSLEIEAQYDPLDQSKSFCDLTYRVVSTSATTIEPCANIDTSGSYVSAFGVKDVEGSWESPPWPISGIATVATDLPSGNVYPIGDGPVSLFEISFDGTGNAYLHNNLQWTSALKKQLLE